MKITILIITIFLVISCAKDALIILDKYDDVKIQNASLLVIFPDTISLINKDSQSWQSKRTNTITNTIFENKENREILNNEDSLKIYLTLFNQEFPKLIKNYTYLSKVIFDSVNREIEYDTKEYKYLDNFDGTKTVIRIKIPKISNSIKNNSFVPDYVLFLQNFNVSITNPQQSLIVGPNVLQSGGSGPGIWHKGNFLIWDNNKIQTAAYGKINSDIDVLALNKEGFLNSFKSVILYIFNNDLFQTKSNFGGKRKW